MNIYMRQKVRVNDQLVNEKSPNLPNVWNVIINFNAPFTRKCLLNGHSQIESRRAGFRFHARLSKNKQKTTKKQCDEEK